MKIYTNTFEMTQPTLNRFWVAPHSNFAIGVKVLGKDGQPVTGVKVYDGETELVAEASKIDNFDIYRLSSGDAGGKIYTVVKGNTKFSLVQVVTDSTVFEQSTEGGSIDPSILSAYATKEWTNEQISDFVDSDELTAYATTDSLTAYAEKADLENYAPVSSLTDYATVSSLTAYATADSLSEKVDKAATGSAPTPNTLRTIYESDWQTVSANADVNTVYVVLPNGN